MATFRFSRWPNSAFLSLALALSACADDPAGIVGPPGTAPAGRAPAGAPVTRSNPLSERSLWVDPASAAARQASLWLSTRPADAAAMDRIAGQPQATWFGDWHPDIRGAVAARTAEVRGSDALPVYVAYNIPLRDCAGHSAGGAAGGAAYRAWVREFAAGLGDAGAVIILEPDALAGIDCLTPAQQEERYALLAEAVSVFGGQGSAVYLDAGHGDWIAAPEMARRLERAGVGRAAGFALNVSNFQTTANSIRYGDAISALTDGRHYVIDTSRNGLGPAPGAQWCNPPGRALGSEPTSRTGHPRVDAFLWIKRPGESDGPCNGGPPAGQWWPEYALLLAANAS